MRPDKIDQRSLNRTTLDRQHLLARSRHSSLELITHLIGMQAQVPSDPYIGLWSRIAEFDPHSVSRLYESRDILRMVVMRGTIHLLSADDAVATRTYAQEVLEQEIRSHREYKEHLNGVDFTPVIAFITPLLTQDARTPTELRTLLQEKFPEFNPAALALVCRNRLPLVQIPPRGLWQESGGLRLITLQSWIGRDCSPISDSGSQELVLRYLAAFGPASPRDVVAWSRAPQLGRAMELLAPQLRPYSTDTSRILFDLPDAALAPADAVSAPRFLPQYDNLLLSHKNRSRFGSDDRRQWISRAGIAKGTVLLNGFIGAAWHISRNALQRPATQAAATIHIEHFYKLSAAALGEVAAEGLALVRLLHPQASNHAVEFTRIPA